jgi:hypothetical protein
MDYGSTVPATQKDYFLLSKADGSGLQWVKVECAGEPEKMRQLLERQGAEVLYSEGHRGYFSPAGATDACVLKSILTAPWIPRRAEGVRLSVYMRNAGNGAYEQTFRVVSCYDLAGWVGKLLKNSSDAAYRSGVFIALVDAFIWLRGFLVNPSAPPLYVLVGLFVGALLYALGVLFEYLFDRFYGRTPAAKIVEADAQA